MRKKNAYPQTLCWRCANAVPDRAGERGFTWSRAGIPVAGWEAVRRDLRLGRLSDGVKLESYRVQKCPCFAPDEQSKAEKLAYPDAIAYINSWVEPAELRERGA